MQNSTLKYYQNQQVRVPHRGLKWSEFPTTGSWGTLTRDYLYDHGLSTQRIGNLETVYPSLDGICFVLLGGERLQDYAYQERLIPPPMLADGKTPLRWRNPIDTSLHNYVFTPWIWEDISNLNSQCIYLVEGCTDALRLYVEGYISIGLLGVGLTEGRKRVVHQIQERVEEIHGTHTIPLRFIADNDGPGESLVGRITREFGCRVLRLPPHAKDVCNLTDEELECILEKQIN